MRNKETIYQPSGVQQVLVAITLCCASMGLLGQTDVTANASQSLSKGQLIFSGTEVLEIILEKPLVRPDVNGIGKIWTRGYMVRLKISEPPAMGPLLDLYLDGEKIPEYGGWEQGIYFWVYDPAQLNILNGQNLSYRFAQQGEQFNLGALEIGDQQYQQVQERDLRQP